jgi:hypothetical protein
MPAAGKSDRVPGDSSARCWRAVDAEQFGGSHWAQGFYCEHSPREMRAADLVRYNTAGKETRYWLKHKADTKELLRSLEKLVGPLAKLK